MTIPWWRQPTVLALLAANCVPLVDTLLLGWRLFEILLLFWLDSVVIGLVSIARFRLAIRAGGAGPGRGSIEWQNRRVAAFAFGYFFFTFLHGLFLILVFGSLELRGRENLGKSLIEYCIEVSLQPAFVIAVLAFIASRCYDLYADWRRPRELARINPGNDMSVVRVIVLQLLVLLGGGAAVLLKAPGAALALLVVLKSVGDIFVHVARERRTD